MGCLSSEGNPEDHTNHLIPFWVEQSINFGRKLRIQPWDRSYYIIHYGLPDGVSKMFSLVFAAIARCSTPKKVGDRML